MILMKTVAVIMGLSSLLMSSVQFYAAPPVVVAKRAPAEVASKGVQRELLLKAVRDAAQKHDVSKELILAVMMVESGGNVRARSHRGAVGLMQLTPATAEMLGVSDPYHYRQNIFGGAKYLAQLLRQFNGDLELALAAYNAGPNAVRRFSRIPPYRETREYVKRVKGRYHRLLASSEA